MPDFFVSCPLGFEKQLAQELENFWHLMLDLDGLPTREAFPELELVKGGLEFSAPLHLGLQINFFTHMGLRVLLRIKKFKARFFDQFEKEMKALPLETYILPESAIHFEIESTKSRLFHEKNLKESFQKVLDKKWKIKSAAMAVHLYIRIFNDEVTVSLDTSGEHLHFRGYRKQQGVAPLRENLAALLLYLAGINKKNGISIVDPFCGAGTLLFEAALLNYPNLARDYAFFHFKNCPGLFKSTTWMKNYRWLAPKNFQLVGIEKDPATFKKAQNNLEIFQKLYFKVDCQLINADSAAVDLQSLFNVSELTNPTVSNHRIWLVANPPYGERLENHDYHKVLQHFEQLENLDGMVVLQPVAAKLAFKNFKISHEIPFANQGLKLNLSIYTRSQ